MQLDKGNTRCCAFFLFEAVGKAQSRLPPFPPRPAASLAGVSRSRCFSHLLHKACVAKSGASGASQLCRLHTPPVPGVSAAVAASMLSSCCCCCCCCCCCQQQSQGSVHQGVQSAAAQGQAAGLHPAIQKGRGPGSRGWRGIRGSNRAGPKDRWVGETLLSVSIYIDVAARSCTMRLRRWQSVPVVTLGNVGRWSW